MYMKRIDNFTVIAGKSALRLCHKEDMLAGHAYDLKKPERVSILCIFGRARRACE